METSFKSTHSNVTHSDDDDCNQQPFEESVGTTTLSTTLPSSSSVTLQSSHHHQPSSSSSIDHHKEGDEDLQSDPTEVRIAASSSSSSHREQQQQQQGGGGHDGHSLQQNGTNIPQEKQPDVSSLYIPTKENHNDNDDEGGDVTTATTTCTITHDTTTTTNDIGDNLDDEKKNLSPPHTNTTTTATTAAITSSTSPVLSAIINSVPNNNTNDMMMMMRSNNLDNDDDDDDDDDSNNSHSDEYDEYDWSPPRHIYALREIIVEELKEEEEGGNALYHHDDDDDGEEGQLMYGDAVDTPRSESPPDDVVQPPTKAVLSTTRRRTRLISSRMVNISGQENVKLGKISRGAVLCTQWRSNNDEEENEEEEEWHTITKGDDHFNIENAFSNQHIRRAASSPHEEEEVVTVCTTDNNNNNNDNNVKEEYITVVPYSIARRRMGCNCRKKVEKDQDEVMSTRSNNTKRRPSLLFKGGVDTICRMVQCTLFCRNSNNNNSNSNNFERDKVAMVEGYCNECNFFGANPTPKQTKKENWLKRRRRRRKSLKSLSFRNVGATIYGDEAVMGNTSEPINEILSIDSSLGIYVCESGLTAVKCQEIIDAAESLAQHKGAWSAYTYAKQTLGCKEYDSLAEASEEPVMTACATIRDRLEQVWATTASASSSSSSSSGSSDDSGEKKTPPGALRAQAVDVQPREGNVEEPMKPKKKELVLDTREPHVVKYDISRMERRKLDMHTDRSVWTFIIALSEGRGQDYAGGGTFFEQLNATVHLQRGQMIIFRGKLRHRGVKILYGRRYLLVGFLVEQKSGSDLKGPSR